MTPEEIYKAAIGKFGTSCQVLKAIEELNELSCALVRHVNLKDPRDDFENVMSEIADVEIVLSQMKQLFPGWLEQYKVKLERLRGVVE